MQIDLTDHLRCPNDHDEAYLVLLPDRMEQRDVVAGHLGCPICGWSTAWADRVPDFGEAWTSTGAPPFDADAAFAMLGLGGPGGWIALAGNAGALAAALVSLLPGVDVVLVNPPEGVSITPPISAVRGGRWPIKSHAMRGVVLGNDVPEHWRPAALASALPGLRVVGVGTPPADGEVLAAAANVWVVRRV